MPSNCTHQVIELKAGNANAEAPGVTHEVSCFPWFRGRHRPCSLREYVQGKHNVTQYVDTESVNDVEKDLPFEILPLPMRGRTIVKACEQNKSKTTLHPIIIIIIMVVAAVVGSIILISCSVVNYLHSIGLDFVVTEQQQNRTPLGLCRSGIAIMATYVRIST